MPSGTVKWFNTVKGFGFIQPDDGSKDVFVHISAVDRAGLSSLHEGQKVEYELVPDNRGRSAAGNLSLVEGVGAISAGPWSVRWPGQRPTAAPILAQ